MNRSIIYILVFLALATFAGIYFVNNSNVDRTSVDSVIESVRAPSRNYTIERDQVYVDRVDSQRQILDMYYPKEEPSKPKPVVVWIHGGGWVSGDKNDDPPIQPLINAGFVVAAMNYRFITNEPHPAQVNDVKAAVRWLRADSENLRIQSNKIALMGFSAGGHLAALAGIGDDIVALEDFSQGNETVSSNVTAVVAMSAPVDFDQFLNQTTSGFNPAALLDLELFLGCEGAACNQALAAASPLNYVDVGDVPVYIQHGEEDGLVPVAQAQSFNSVLQNFGLESELEIVKESGHTYDVNQRVIDFLNKTLK